MGRGNFRGIGRPIVKYRDVRLELCKKAEPVKIPFAMLSSVEPGNHVLRVDGGADVSTGRITFRGVYGPLQSIGFWGLGKM